MDNYRKFPIITGASHSVRYLDSRINRVLTAANDLRDGASGEVGFIHATLCQTFLPCGKPQIGLRKWESINGHSAMRIEAGTAFDSNSGKWIDLPLPSGIKARLALIYLSTLAVKKQIAYCAIG